MVINLAVRCTYVNDWTLCKYSNKYSHQYSSPLSASRYATHSSGLSCAVCMAFKPLLSPMTSAALLLLSLCKMLFGFTHVVSFLQSVRVHCLIVRGGLWQLVHCYWCMVVHAMELLFGIKPIGST